MHTSALNYQSGNEMKMKSDKRSLQWVARRAQVAEERGDQCEGYPRSVRLREKASQWRTEAS